MKKIGFALTLALLALWASGQSVNIVTNDPAVNDAKVYRGSTGNLVYSFSLQITGHPVILKSVQLHTISCHTDIVNYRLLSNTKNSLVGAKNLLPNVPPVSDTLVKFMLAEEEILAPGSNPYYFFIVADMAPAVANDAERTFQVKKINFGDFEFLSVNPRIGHTVDTYDGGVQSIIKQEVAVTDNAPQVAGASVVTNSLKNPVYTFRISPRGNEVTLKSIRFSPAGDFRDVTKYRLWFGNSNDLDKADLLDSVTNLSSAISFAFNAGNKTIAGGATGYFWITADIRDLAPPGDGFLIKALAAADITSDRDQYTVTTTDGGRQTITAPEISVADNAAQVSPRNLVAGSMDNILYSFTIAPLKGDAFLNGLTFEKNGPRSARDIVRYRLWYCDSNNFRYASSLADVSGLSNAASYEFGGFHQKIANNKTGYFWITADIAEKPQLGDMFCVRAVDGAHMNLSRSAIKNNTTEGGYQTISCPAVRDSAFITFLNGANFDFSSNVSGSYIAEFNVFDANLFKIEKNHRWGMAFGIQKINYTSGNIKGNDSSDIAFGPQNFLLNPLQRSSVNNKGYIDSGSRYVQQYRKFKSSSKNTVWSVFAQPTFRISRHKLNDPPNEGFYAHAYAEFLLNQWTKNVSISTLYQNPDTIETTKMVSDSGFYWVAGDTIVSNYNFISGYYGLGISLYEHIAHDTTSHFFGQFTIGRAVQTPNFNFLLNTVPAVSGRVPLNRAINTKGNWFYLVKAEFSKNISKSQLVIGAEFRSNFSAQTEQYAIYVGLNLNLSSVFQSL